MYDIKFDKNLMSCLLFRQNSKLYNLTTENCVLQKNIILKKNWFEVKIAWKQATGVIYINTLYIYIGYLFLLKENL